jgi:hypothetical protein
MKGYQTFNGFFHSEIDLHKSPLEPGIFLYPAGVVKEKPPKTDENEIAFWDGSKWGIKPDYSGKTYYNKHDKTERRFEQGEPFDENFTDITPPEGMFYIFGGNEWIIDETAKAEFERKKRIAEIQSQLDNIDRQSVRPLRAKLAGTDTEADRERLEELEAAASTLRTELNELSGTPAEEE